MSFAFSATRVSRSVDWSLSVTESFSRSSLPTPRANVGARKTTMTEIGCYAGDGSVGEPLWAVFEAGVNTAGPQAVNALNPPKIGYLPKTIDAGDYIEVPISSSDLRRVAVGSPTNEGRGISGFWVKEATGTMTRVPIAPHVLSGLIEWSNVRWWRPWNPRSRGRIVDCAGGLEGD